VARRNRSRGMDRLCRRWERATPPVRKRGPHERDVPAQADDTAVSPFGRCHSSCAGEPTELKDGGGPRGIQDRHGTPCSLNAPFPVSDAVHGWTADGQLMPNRDVVDLCPPEPNGVRPFLKDVSQSILSARSARARRRQASPGQPPPRICSPYCSPWRPGKHDS